MTTTLPNPPAPPAHGPPTAPGPAPPRPAAAGRAVGRRTGRVPSGRALLGALLVAARRARPVRRLPRRRLRPHHPLRRRRPRRPARHRARPRTTSSWRRSSCRRTSATTPSPRSTTWLGMVTVAPIGQGELIQGSAVERRPRARIGRVHHELRHRGRSRRRGPARARAARHHPGHLHRWAGGGHRGRGPGRHGHLLHPGRRCRPRRPRRERPHRAAAGHRQPARRRPRRPGGRDHHHRPDLRGRRARCPPTSGPTCPSAAPTPGPTAKPRAAARAADAR